MRRAGARRLGLLLPAAVLAALALGAVGAAARPPSLRAVLHAPERSVRVSWGRIGYRAVGHGSPLVLIMGLSGSIDAWPPDFIAGLAARHRVIALDNEGIGLSTLRPGRLSIPRMADDTAALVRALHLGRPDVLGWSMGGFIAQAYAVRHPRLIRRLVLSATAPGDGRAALPSAQVLGSLSGAGALAFLFPPDQARYRGAYVKAISAWPGFHLPSAAVTAAQLAASAAWMAGHDRAGHLVARLRIPVLIGDGREDAILPSRNTVRLGRLIAGARVKLYPDAGHGFLFQDERSWVAAIDRFLAARSA